MERVGERSETETETAVSTEELVTETERGRGGTRRIQEVTRLEAGKGSLRAEEAWRKNLAQLTQWRRLAITMVSCPEPGESLRQAGGKKDKLRKAASEDEEGPTVSKAGVNVWLQGK